MMKPEAKTKITMVRHGETDWNLSGKSQGQTDVPLNSRGIAQAEAIGLALADQQFDVIYSSPLSRALDTAAAITEGRNGAAPQTDDRLMEISLGEVEGVDYRKMSGAEAEIIRAWWANPGEAKFPGGESTAEVADRAHDFYKHIITEHPGKRILVVAHYFVLATLLCRVIDLPLNSIWRLKLSNASISILLHSEMFGSRLALFNQVLWKPEDLPQPPEGE